MQLISTSTFSAIYKTTNILQTLFTTPQPLIQLRTPHPLGNRTPNAPHHCSRAQSPPMAGGHLKYRHLSRDSAHRQSLLRNLVTSLITHESIRTTWPKAKEAQRLAEKLITLGKKNTNASRNRAEQIFFVGSPPAPLLAS